jgi:biopolymer transport protein TolR
MVTAHLMQQGIDVELPKTQSEGLNNDSEPLVLTVKDEGQILLQTAVVPMEELESKLKKIFETRTNKEVFLRADKRVAYGTVAEALAVLRRAGASRIGMVTEPRA